MDTLEEIEKKLQQASSILDDVAGSLVLSDLKCCAANIQNIGEAIVAISDVQNSIYEQRPDLKPEHLIDKDINRHENKTFGRILIQNEQKLSNNKPMEAILLLQEFKDSKPSKDYVEMATNETNRITNIFNLKTYD